MSVEPLTVRPATSVVLSNRDAKKWHLYLESTVLRIEDGVLMVVGLHGKDFRYALATEGVAAPGAVAGLGFCQRRYGYAWVTTMQVRAVGGDVLLDVPAMTEGSVGLWDRAEVANFAGAAGLGYFEESNVNGEKANRGGPTRRASGHATLPGPSRRARLVVIAALFLIWCCHRSDRGDHGGRMNGFGKDISSCSGGRKSMADGSRRVLAAGRLGAGLMMLSAIALLTGCGSQTTAQKALPLLHVRLGTQVALPEAARGDGFDKVTVYALRDPVVSANPSAAADQGYQLSAADVEVCAGRDGASTNNSTVLFPFPFQLTLSDGSFEGMLNDPTTQPPAISNVASKLRPNQCARGFAPFEHKRSLSVRAVGFGSPDAPIFEWAVSEPAP